MGGWAPFIGDIMMDRAVVYGFRPVTRQSVHRVILWMRDAVSGVDFVILLMFNNFMPASTKARFIYICI